MAEPFKVGAVGADIILEVRDQDDAIDDISGASALKMVFKMPKITGSDVRKVITRTATLNGTGTDGKMKYRTVAGDEVLSMAGTWEVEGEYTKSAFTGRTATEKFKVVDVLRPEGIAS